MSGITTLGQMANSILKNTREPDDQRMRSEIQGIGAVANELEPTEGVQVIKDVVAEVLRRDDALASCKSFDPHYTWYKANPYRVGCFQAGLSVIASLTGGLAGNAIDRATDAVVAGQSWATPFVCERYANAAKNRELVSTGMKLVEIVARHVPEA